MEFPKRKVLLRSLFQDDQAQQTDQDTDLTLRGEPKDAYVIDSFHNRLIKSKLIQNSNRSKSQSRLKASIQSITLGSFIDPLSQEGDFVPDALTPTNAFNSNPSEQEWKNTFKKFQRTHVPTVLPKITTKHLSASHYNLTSLSSNRIDTATMTTNLEQPPCLTCRSRGIQQQVTQEGHVESQMFDKRLKHQKRISFIENKFKKQNKNIQPIVEYPKLKEIVNDTIIKQVKSAKNHDYYLSKNKFQKYGQGENIDRINQEQVKRDKSVDGSFHMMMTMKEQELKTLFETFKRIQPSVRKQ